MRHLELFLSCLCLLSACVASAGKTDERLMVAKISPALLSNAHAVVRNSSVQVNIVSLSKVVVENRLVITILDKKAEALADFKQPSSSISRIKKTEGRIYDKNGVVVRSIGKGDFQERTIATDYVAYTDAREVYYENVYHSYPFTVEYIWTEEQSVTFLLPAWQPIHRTGISLEKAVFQISYPQDIKLYYKYINGERIIDSSYTEDSRKTTQWILVNCGAVKNEAGAYGIDYGLPLVRIALDRVRIGTYEGRVTSWKEFGDFMYQIDSARDVLPSEAITHIRALVSEEPNDLAKARKLYEYLQHNTRYVALEYGIGGWQTLDASFVHRNKYGDCKALSNYMKAMLTAVGIKAYPVLLWADENGKGEFIMDLVCSQFNHEILAIPSGKDTLFLECTSNMNPFGYLGSFTQNREGLMITPEGGVLVHTPAYNSSFNKLERRAIVHFDESLKPTIQYHNRHWGFFFLKRLASTNGLSEQNKRDFVNSMLSLPSSEIINYREHSQPQLPVPLFTENIEAKAEGMTGTTGNFVQVNMDYVPLSFYRIGASEVEDRKLPFRIINSFSSLDTVEVQLPAGYQVETVPADLKLQTAFGQYECRMVQKGNTVEMQRMLVLQEGVYPASLYASFIDFFDQAGRQMRKGLLLRKP